LKIAEPGVPRTAGRLLPKKNISSVGFFGGEHAYDLKF
jgi:splicing factor 3B subunit 2